MLPLLLLTACSPEDSSAPACAPLGATDPTIVSFAGVTPAIQPCCGPATEDPTLPGLFVTASRPMASLTIHLGTDAPSEGCVAATDLTYGALSIGMDVPLRLVEYEITELTPAKDQIRVDVRRAWFEAGGHWRVVEDLPPGEGWGIAAVR